jgi:hypothetical protein
MGFCGKMGFLGALAASESDGSIQSAAAGRRAASQPDHVRTQALANPANRHRSMQVGYMQRCTMKEFSFNFQTEVEETREVALTARQISSSICRTVSI